MLRLRNNSRQGQRLITALVLFWLFCFFGWQGYNLYEKNCHYRETRFLFDTEVFIEAHGWGAKRAVGEAFATLQELHQKLNKFSPDSEIYLLNSKAGLEPVEVSALTFDLIEYSLYFSRITDGAFDPTVAPLVKLWGFGEDKPQKVPAVEDIRQALRLVGYQKVVLDKERRTVYLPEKGMSLDLGAIAKGYAVKQAVNILKNNNISSALVTAGGNIYALGRKENGEPWKIGIRDPLQQGGIIGYVQLENEVIDTSGDYERYFWEEGQRYSHIIDPRSGYPVQGLSSCSVLTDDPCAADALATAVMVLGAEKGLDLIEQQKIMGVLITSNGKIILSQKMQGRFQEWEEIVYYNQ
ncbi:MAG TPA: FAD:protein FMN transferase [Peptococcaceae bacterium]|nr:FAD:protein FMN transferase [Peptococcaceae bacterium]